MEKISHVAASRLRKKNIIYYNQRIFVLIFLLLLVVVVVDVIADADNRIATPHVAPCIQGPRASLSHLVTGVEVKM